MATEKTTVCERCGEPCGNEPICGTCLARDPQPEATEDE